MSVTQLSPFRNWRERETKTTYGWYYTPRCTWLDDFICDNSSVSDETRSVLASTDRETDRKLHLAKKDEDVVRSLEFAGVRGVWHEASASCLQVLCQGWMSVRAIRLRVVRSHFVSLLRCCLCWSWLILVMCWCRICISWQDFLTIEIMYACVISLSASFMSFVNILQYFLLSLRMDDVITFTFNRSSVARVTRSMLSLHRCSLTRLWFVVTRGVMDEPSCSRNDCISYSRLLDASLIVISLTDNRERVRHQWIRVE